jgi:hypothetical protein
MKEENIIKVVCKKLDITYGQLSDAIGYTENAIKKAASTGAISKPMQKAIEIYLKNIELKKSLQDFNKLISIIKENS